MLPRKRVDLQSKRQELQDRSPSLRHLQLAVIERGAGRAAVVDNAHARYLEPRVRRQLVNTHTGELCLRSSGPSLCTDELGQKFPLDTCSPRLSLEAREPACTVETKFSFWLFANHLLSWCACVHRRLGV